MHRNQDSKLCLSDVNQVLLLITALLSYWFFSFCLMHSYLGTGVAHSSGLKMLQGLGHSPHWAVGSVSSFLHSELACDYFDKCTVMTVMLGQPQDSPLKGLATSLWPPGAQNLRGPCSEGAQTSHIERPYGDRESCSAGPHLFRP